MSKYTTQLRWIVEQIGQGLDVPDGQEYANAVYKYIGLSKYPIFDEAYRTTLNDKIIDHYFFREIGQETAAQFAQMMKRTMQEIMPKYNRLYNAIETDLNHPLSDFTRHRNIDEDFTSEIDGATSSRSDGTSSASSTDHNRNVFQDTPMSLLSNDGSPSIEDLDYATNVTYNDSNGTTSGTTASVNNGTSSSDRTDNKVREEDEYGRNKTLAYLINEYAEKFIDIDVLIINDLEDLFFKLW
ncbi:MAG: hypothetical protein II011_00575 [Prevotella sp.]|nr:hypothetical protein [Prevotella sp.]MBQ1799227.1 hypothetical protein [Prevotella sp.]